MTGYTPSGLAVLNSNEVIVSFPYENKISVVEIHPDLKIKTTTHTQKSYFGLAVLDQNTIVASSVDLPSVDILDMSGKITKSFVSVVGRLKCPSHLHITSQGNIVISDWAIRSVITLTRNGNITHIYKLSNKSIPFGITSTKQGDIIVATLFADSIIHLCDRGEYKTILTPADGLVHPTGIMMDGNKLYVVTNHEGVKIYTLKRCTFTGVQKKLYKAKLTNFHSE